MVLYNELGIGIIARTQSRSYIIVRMVCVCVCVCVCVYSLLHFILAVMTSYALAISNSDIVTLYRTQQAVVQFKYWFNIRTCPLYQS